MLKKTVALLLIVGSLVACSSGEVKKDKAVEAVVVNEAAENITDVVVEEFVGELKVTWKLKSPEKYSSIDIIQKNGDGTREKIKLDSSVTEFVCKANPMSITKFKIKTVLLSGKKSKNLTVKGKAKLGFKLTKTDEYIDIDSSTMKILLNVNDGATVDLYLGESKDALSLYKSFEKVGQDSGVKIDELEVGKTYFYKVVAKYDGKELLSEVHSFVKMEKEKKRVSPEWAKNSVFYEVFVRSFYDGTGDGTGDFVGLTEKLDYLSDLGVDALWLMPSFESPSYHGYDVVDYLAVDKEYGTMEEFETFLDEAHKRGIKVVLDLIVNHTSVDHEWFKKASSGDEEYRDYYVWADEFTDKYASGGWGQSMWHEASDGDFYYGIFWSGMPDLNFRNKKVREEIKAITGYWIDKGVDGFRMDASKHVDDFSKENTLAWWLEFDNYVRSKNPDIFVVGENWYEDPEMIAPFLNTMDSSFNFGLKDEIKRMAQGEYVDIIDYISKMEEAYDKHTDSYIDTTFIGNHDMNRVASDFDGDKDKIKLAAAILMTLPGTPFIYYGDELGQLGAKPDASIREGFDWYASGSGEGMAKSGHEIYTKANDGISLEEQKDDDDSVYNYYKELIKVRKENGEFFGGEYKKIDSVEGTYGYLIDGKVGVIHNLSDKEVEIGELVAGKEVIFGEGTIIKPYGTVVFKSENR